MNVAYVKAPSAPVALAEQVADHLRELVIRGVLEPGEHIVERRLCAQLAVSRTPMREALKLLRADGLVEISRNRGARVTAYSPDEARHLFDVIAALEGAAAEQLAGRLDAATLEGFEALHADMRAHHRAGSLDPYFSVNTQIHDAIVAQCGNPLIGESRARLMLRARRGRYMAIMEADRWREAVDEHEMLMEAFRAGDAGAAGAVWRRHLSNTGVSVERALSRA